MTSVVDLEVAWLTQVVLRMALQQCRHWLDSGRRVPVAVNLSVRGLLDPDHHDFGKAELGLERVDHFSRLKQVWLVHRK